MGGEGGEVAQAHLGAADGAAEGAYMMYTEADPASGFGYGGALLQRVVNPSDGVVRHREKKARRELGFGRPGVEEGGAGVNEPFFTHEMVGLVPVVEWWVSGG